MGGEEPQCIARNRCDDNGFEGGECVVGLKNKPSRNNNQCEMAIENTWDETRRLRKNKIKKRTRRRKRRRKEANIEKCSGFSGDNNESSCFTCLGQGCSWIQQLKECLDSCEDAPADVSCVKDDV